MNWESALTEFSMYNRFEQALAESTNKVYSQILNRYADYFYQIYVIESPTELNAEFIRKFLAYLTFDLSLQTKAYASNLSVIRAFHQFLKSEGATDSDPTEKIDNPKLTKHITIRTLNAKEIKKVIEYYDSSEDKVRNRAMLELLYSSGVRASELVNLELQNIDWGNEAIQVVGKGRRHRWIPVLKTAIDYMLIYKNEVRSKLESKSSVFFLSARGNKMRREDVYRAVRVASEATIKKTIGPHVFRHTFATHMIEGGADLRTIQEMLGHTSILTTERYLHVSRKHLKSSMEKFHPRWD